MKETVIGISILLVLALGYVFMPFEWRRHKDIRLGNDLIVKIELHQKTHHRLPENNDEAFFQTAGFHRDKQFGWQPNYRRTTQGFELVYENGYAKPFLSWNSQERQWHLKD